MTLIDSIYRAGFTPTQFCKLIQISFRTLKRWEKTNKMPAAVRLLLDILGGGLHHIPHANRHWTGWHFRNGGLFDPQGSETHTPQSIRGWWWLSERLAMLDRETNAVVYNVAENIIPLHTERLKLPERLRKELYRKLKEP